MEGKPSSAAPPEGPDRRGARRPGPWPPKIDPFVARADHHDVRELMSWARRTGFNPNLSGETTASTASDLNVRAPPTPPAAAAEADRDPERADEWPILGRKRNAAPESDGVPGSVPDPARTAGPRVDPPAVTLGEVGVEAKGEAARNGVGNARMRDAGEDAAAGKNVEIDMFSGTDDVEEEEGKDVPARPPGLNCGITENPGYHRLFYYGLQHYLSLAGSLVFIPLIIVPAMGGNDEETATVISTMLLVSGVTTLLHSYFGTRLPLVQGGAFAYLAPALVIINSEEFRNLSENKFKHIMRELQGAIVVGSFFQMFLGYSGLMSLLLRFINPVVVSPTISAIGLAYFSYGFPQAGSCAEISIPLILLVLIFTLYLRKISLFGHRIFLIYAVPLSVAIVWGCAFFLTTGGAYDYKGCSPNIPSSNILLDSCRRHVLSMKRCRTDASNAWKTAAWVRVPYPFQWGFPTFHFKTSFVMVITALVASVDSVGSYHATSLLIDLRPPTPGIVSRGIGFEGFTSILAGFWGTGTGSTTLTENIHTIDVTKMACRRALEVGAALMILFSILGKVGALLASIPLALAAAILCFIWGLIVALGLSTLQYTQTASPRNIIIVGFSLFISLSIPAYIQQDQPISSLILPGYLIPYGAASNGPVHTGSQSLNYVLNALLSLNMVVALFVAFVLDNTVPGSREERGVYIWSKASDSIEDGDPSLLTYHLPKKVGCLFKWAKCVG